LDALAIRAGVPEGDRTDVQTILILLPVFARPGASMLLQGIQAADESPGMVFAARYVLSLAQEVWLPAARAPDT
jgi:hypothetical protein